MEDLVATLHICAVRMGHLLFRVRDYLFPILFIGLLCTTWPRFPFNSERVDWWMDLCGLLVAMLGQGCRVLAIGSVSNIRRGGRGRRMVADQLIHTGFFAHTRNPLYLGNLLIFTGLTLIANSYAWYAVALPIVIGMYWALTLAEEDFLARTFGEPYVRYRQTVHRFVPKLSGLQASLRTCHLDWRQIVHKEYGIVCSWLSMALGLLIWERWEHFGFAARAVEIDKLVFAFVVLGIVYAGIRGFTRRGRIPTRT